VRRASTGQRVCSGEQGEVDPEGTGDSIDELGAWCAGTTFDLVQEAVRVGQPVSELPLCQVRQAALLSDACTGAVVVGCGHTGLRS
jgi:hypothetical protein